MVDKKILMNRTLCLLRRDLRLKENLLIQKAIELNFPVIFLYIFDENEKPNIGSASKWWLYHSLSSFAENLSEKLNSTLILKKSDVLKILKDFCNKHKITNLIHSEGFGEYLVNLDLEIENFCKKENILHLL